MFAFPPINLSLKNSAFIVVTHIDAAALRQLEYFLTLVTDHVTIFRKKGPTPVWTFLFGATPMKYVRFLIPWNGAYFLSLVSLSLPSQYRGRCLTWVLIAADVNHV